MLHLWDRMGSLETLSFLVVSEVCMFKAYRLRKSGFGGLGLPYNFRRLVICLAGKILLERALGIKSYPRSFS
jgi:hypothetical protein